MSTALESPTGSPGPAEVRLDPYVGPEPFRREDAWRFFGRREQAEELLSFVIASRTVLLYAQSGAGKTSLVNAGLLPLAEAEGFDILPPARVRGVLPEGLTLDALSNPYCYFTLLSWRGSGTGAAADPQGTLSDALRARPRPEDRFGTAVPRLLVFDQFEELFTSYPEHWAKRRVLFEQVREALDDDPELRVLFVIREDHLADLWAMADLTPDSMRSRFRLSRLGPEEAIAAIEQPLEHTDRSFAGGVVEELVKELLEVRVETRPGVATEIAGEFVEPVQLQVVCSGLWKSLPEGATVITAEHAQRFGNVTAALMEFYADAVAETSVATGVKGRRVREWCSVALITAAGTRAMVYRGVEETEGMPNPVVDALEDRHIVRAESRAGARWYELTHDRFIDPIQQSNAREEQLRRREHRLGLAIAAGIVVSISSVGLVAVSRVSIRGLSLPYAAAAILLVGAIIRLGPHHRKMRVGVGIALALVLLAFPVTYFHVTSVVPRVANLGTQLAVLRLKARGFGVTVFGRKSETVPPGSVIDTLPDAGSRNRRGTFVMVEFSAGRNPLPVPNVVGLDTQVAFPQLVGLGLIVLELREPNPLPAGRVIDTDPPANTLVAPGDRITVSVSSGSGGSG